MSTHSVARRSRKAFLFLAVAAQFASGVMSVSAAIFADTHTFDAQTPSFSWGNPIWGDINGDKYLDVIIPTLNADGTARALVYLNSGLPGYTFREVTDNSGISQLITDKSRLDWLRIWRL